MLVDVSVQIYSWMEPTTEIRQHSRSFLRKWPICSSLEWKSAPVSWKPWCSGHKQIVGPDKHEGYTYRIRPHDHNNEVMIARSPFRPLRLVFISLSNLHLHLHRGSPIKQFAKYSTMSKPYATEEQVAVAAVRRACHLTASVFNKLVRNETLTKGDKSPVTGQEYTFCVERGV